VAVVVCSIPDRNLNYIVILRSLDKNVETPNLGVSAIFNGVSIIFNIEDLWSNKSLLS
jgi:hypothetical protein